MPIFLKKLFLCSVFKPNSQPFFGDYLFAQNVKLCADGNAAGSEVPHHPGEAGGGDPPGLAGRHPHPPHRGHQVRVQSATESEAQGQTQRGQGGPPPQQQ